MKDPTPRRRYPPFFEKIIPIAIVTILVIVIILITITLAVIFGGFPGAR